MSSSEELEKSKGDPDSGKPSDGDEEEEEVPDVDDADLAEVPESASLKKSGAVLPDGDQVEIPVVGFWRQLWFATKKNHILMIRRPFILACMLLSSVVSVLAAWPIVKDDDTWDFADVPLDACGTVNYDFYSSFNYDANGDYTNGGSSIPFSYNDAWRDSSAVAVLGLGPLILAIGVVLLVQPEFEMKMVGVLRSLGLRESVYWISWWISFLWVAVVNALLGAMTAKFVENVHAYQAIDFGAIFVSLLFLSIALIGASFLLTALSSGSRILSAIFVMIMILAAFIPYFVSKSQSNIPSNVEAVNSAYQNTPVGLFWVNSNTSYASTYTISTDVGFQVIGINTTSCEKPLMSEDEADNQKSEAERAEVTPDDYFLGCYFAAGYGSYLNEDYSGISRFVMNAIPYTNFLNIWGNMLGYTGMPGNDFSLFDHFSMSAESLANRSIDTITYRDGDGTTLYRQGSTLLRYYVSTGYDPVTYRTLYNCPLTNSSDVGFCNLYQCDGSKETESTSSSGMVGILVGFAFLYSIVAAYFASVVTVGNGAAQPFYFPFLPSYWCAGARPKRDNVSQGGTGVSTDSIFKIYGENHAVNDVSVSLAVGEVTALLGHNGAGKTTLSHMLCCETLPSKGFASIFGMDVVQKKFIVRQLIGVCKQDDYLYPNMTAREHLELYAGLRGVKGEEIESVVQEWLESVDLQLVQNGLSSSFSGGMKRRLSVACSTIGGRPFIVLDEPTTGMDPVSRRFIWKHVDRIKEGRVVLLTTHAMEEADLLADSVVIMRKGVVAATGSPLKLKAEHGSSLQFNLLINQENMETTLELIKERFAGAEEFVSVEGGAAGNATVSIKKVQESDADEGISVEMLSDFASFLESGASGITEYGFSNSSLEEVFLKVTESKEEEEGEFSEGKKVDGGEEEEGEEEETADKHDPEEEDEEEDLVVDDKAISGIGSFLPELTLKGQFKAMLRFFFIRDWTGRSSIGNWITNGILFTGTILIAPLSAKTLENAGILAMVIFTLSVLMISLLAPHFQERYTGLFYLTRAQGMLKKSYLFSQTTYAFLVTLIFAFALLSLFYATPIWRNSEFCDLKENSWGSFYCPSFTYGDVYTYDTESAAQIEFWSDFVDVDGNSTRVELYARRTPGGYQFVLAVAIVYALAMPGFIFALLHIPGYKLATSILTCLVLGLTAIPIIFYAVLQGSDGSSQLDDCKEDLCGNTTEFNITAGINGRDFLNCVGLDVNNDQISAQCIEDYASLLPQFGVFLGLYRTLQMKFTLSSNVDGYVENTLMPSFYGDYDCDGTECYFPYSRNHWGITLGYMTLGAVILFVLGFSMVSLFSYPGERVLAFRGYLRNMLRRICFCHCGSGKATKEKENEGTDEEDTEISPEVLEEIQEVESIAAPFMTTNGPQVTIDYSAIPPRDEVPPVLARKLRKEYPLPGGFSTKVALQSLDLHVPRGQVLGLLGKNGAGKTTALKIFAGGHDATSGIALVAGYDVASEQIRVFERLGNCPQFDIVWPSQTIKTHLEFFGGLKGLPGDRLKDIAHAVASSVGLGAPDVYTRRAGALSGGMRRRLSIAISLIGAPKVLLLDEPTTGLDPSTRNTIWDLIGSFATEERAIVITTHMMLEADSLCNRIAICAKGKLITIGSQQWLKNRYGSGYLLQLNLTSSSQESVDNAMNFVRQRLHPDAQLQTRQAKTLHVALPRDVSLGDVFHVLYSKERFEAGNINQFLFSQSSLEDVFIALGE